MPEEAPYDPYIPSGQSAPQKGAQGAGGNSRTQALQAVRTSDLRDAVLFSRADWNRATGNLGLPFLDGFWQTRRGRRSRLSPATTLKEQDLTPRRVLRCTCGACDLLSVQTMAACDLLLLDQREITKLTFAH